jgi:translation initiation factor 6 (eIF-6)
MITFLLLDVQEERLSALGNCIVTNDHVALVHTDIDRVCARVHLILQYRPYFVFFILK